MEVCTAFTLLAVVLFLFAVIGHGLWLVLAAVVRAIGGQSHPEPAPELPARRTCARCGTAFARQADVCPSCGLDPRGAVAIELRELEITTRHIQELVENHSLEPAVGEQIYKLIEARQTTLLGGKPVPAAPPPKPAADVPPYRAVPVTEEPLWRQLERLLATCQDVRNLTVAHRKQALGWYRQLAERQELNELSAAGLLKLARLLRTAALITRPLDVYQLLLDTHPNAPEAPQGAREAARFAAAEHLPETARPFLEWLLARARGEDDRREIFDQLRDLAEAPPAERPAAPRPEPFPDEPAATPAAPRRSWGELLAGFMEERNILWGELVGGLLIVGCSIALVISLWQTLEQIPYFPFLILAAITAALFGAGHYTLHHWKLESTSRGLLVIATLLTPLDFLVVAGLSRGQQAGWLDLAVEGGALAGFAALLLPSARTLVGKLPAILGQPAWWLTLAVLGSSAGQLLVPRWVEPADTSGWFLPIGFLPVTCQVLAVGAVLLALARRDRLEGDAANALFLFVGQATFAAAIALGFLVYWNEHTLQALRHLAMPLAVAGMPVLITGALVHRLLEGAGPETVGRGLSPGVARLVGTVITLAGMLVMLGALMLTWPRPGGLMVIGAVNAAAFTVAALRYRLPVLHVPALGCLAVLWLTAWHGLLGNLAAEETGRHLLALARSPQSGSLLAGLTVFLALTAEFGVRAGRHGDGLYHLLGGGVAALLALLLVSQPSAAIHERAAPVYAVCGLGGLIVNLRWRQPLLSYAGSLALLGAIGHALWWANPGLTVPRLTLLALLIEATWMLALAFLLARGATPSREAAFVLPFLRGGLAASFVAVVPLALAVQWSWLIGCCLCTLWLAVLWLVTALLKRWPGLFQAFQAALTAAVLLGVSAWSGVPGTVWGLFWPDRLQTYFLALAVLSLAWVVLRRVMQSRPQARALLEMKWGAVDRVVLAAVVIAQLLLAVGILLPQVVREFVPVSLNQIAPLLRLFDAGSAWILLGILGLALVMHLWGGRPHESILGGVLLGLTVPVLAAYAFRGELAAASALRWCLAIAFVGYSTLLWARRPLWHGLGRLGIWWTTALHVPRGVRGMLLAGAVLPVLVLTWLIATMGFSGQQPAGPAEGSLFAHMGWTVSAVGPLVLLVFGLVGHGVREDSEGYVFGAGLLAAVTLMGGYALGVVTGGGVIDTAEAVFVWQLGAIGLAVWGLIWLASGRWRRPSLLAVHIALGLLVNIGLGVVAFLFVALRPTPPSPSELEAYVLAAGRSAGWLGLLLTLMLGVWYARRTLPAGVVHVLGLGGLLIGIQTACTAVAWDVDGWEDTCLAYHTLTAVWTFAGFVLLAGGWAGSSLRRAGPGFWSEERRAQSAALLRQLFPARPTRYWVEAFGAAVVLLALGGDVLDLARPPWPFASTLAAAVLLGADAVWSRRPSLVYFSGLLVNVTGFLLWRSWLAAEWEDWNVIPWQPDMVPRFLFVQIIGLGAASACWSLLEFKLRRLATPIDLRGRWIPFAHAAALAAVQLLALVVLVGITGDFTRTHINMTGPLGWAALAATLAAVALCFWDAEASHWGLPVAPLYVCGLLALGMVLHGFRLPPRDLSWAVTLPLSAYLAICAAAVWLAPRGIRLWRRMRIPARVDSGLVPWFLPAHALLGALVLCLSLWLCLDVAPLGQRLTGPAAAALLTLTGVILARCLPALVAGEKAAAEAGHFLRQCVLDLGLLTALELGWGWLGPDFPVLWLHRNVLLLAVLIVFAALYGSRFAGKLGQESAWAVSARRLGGVLAGLAVVVLAVVLVQEFLLYDPDMRRVPLAWPAAVLVGALLTAILVGGLWVALNPRRDPFGLSERGRLGAVYGAEVILVLLLVHVRLNVLDLFPGFLGRNWPLVLMTLGFAGVGLAELFHRRGLPVLAGPLRQTGLFLPLVPLLAFLLRPLSELPSRNVLAVAVPGFQPLFRYLDLLPSHHGTHALLWFLLGILYALVAVLRRSSAFALLAALAANFGLWVIYAHVEGLEFVLHPQLWLIPVGLILLVAEHLNRPHLTASQSQGVRYVGLLLIYLSSTADLFITGLGNSVVLPLALAVLSVAGVLAGILLRVRAFLLMGVSFLFLVVFSQIWHAAVDRAQTWVWWASGIVLGAAILTLFALFEKRRNDVLRVIEEIKAWR